jgi:hypothetical protein
MIHAQDEKVVTALLGEEVGTTDVTTIIDTLGFEYASIEIDGAAAAATTTVSKMNIGERDGTSGAFTAIVDKDDIGVVAPATTAPNLYRVGLPLGPRKRYLQVTLANAAARDMTVKARLSRAKQTPVDKGVTSEVIVTG